jgi:ketosteroid isomerase-like protein
MSIAENKRLVREWVRRWNAGDVEGIAELYDEKHFSWRISGLSPVSRKYTRGEILGIIGQTFARPMKRPHNLEIKHLTAEEDRVALEAVGSAQFADGADFLNYYHIAFTLADGKIVKGRAYLDTWVAAQSAMQAPTADPASGAGIADRSA